MKEYKSSPGRLTRLLEKRVETWKAKATEKQKTIKRLMGDVGKKSESRDYWKKKAKATEKALRELESKHSREQKNRGSSPGEETETFHRVGRSRTTSVTSPHEKGFLAKTKGPSL